MSKRKSQQKVGVEINNLSNYRISKKLIRMVCKETIFVFAEKMPRKNYSISIGLVDEENIRTLNREYRLKDKATDVLSFCEFEKSSEIFSAKEDVYLGELILCPSYIEKRAVAQKNDWQSDFFEAIAHGVLHLLGAKHGKRMFSIQENIKESLNAFSL